MKLRNPQDLENERAFYEAVLSLGSMEECENFFDDICTVGEIAAISARLRVAKLLADGCVYHDIAEKTGASTATISRVNHSMMYGSGGYAAVLEHLKKESEK